MKKYLFFLLVIISSCKKSDIQVYEKTDIKVNQSEQNFNGYKVDINAKKLGKEYWENTGVLSDFIAIKFSKSPRGFDKIGSGSSTICGDFNVDGYIDVFVAGGSYMNIVNISTSFLIWNPTTKSFDNKNLFNNNFEIEKRNIPKIVPFYFNNDDYVDLILFCTEDEGISEYKPYKVVLVLSDGMGKYNQHEITTETPTISHYGGDVGDLNQDNIPDLVVTCGGLMKILWGQLSSPYFDESNSITFANSIVNLPPNGTPVYYQNDNGFNESCPECISEFVHNCKITDINNDKLNDLVLCNNENSKSTSIILLNLGMGRFNKSSIIKLPNYDETKSIMFTNIDYIIDDINSDGLKDIVSVNTKSYRGWDIFAYLQTEKNKFEIDKSNIIYSINAERKGNWKSRLIYYDYDKDGIKDITYLDDAYEPTQNKGVFIKINKNYIERSILDYDFYLKSLHN
jgi:hypothetical protein